MPEGPTRQDWAVLGLKPGTSLAEVERAFLRRRALYERESLATYTLLTDDERSQMLERLNLAYCNIMGKQPVRSLQRPAAPAEPPMITPRPRRPLTPAAPAASAPAEPPPAEPTSASATEVPEPAPQEPAPPAPAKPAPPRRPVAPPPPEEPRPDPQRAPGAFLRYSRRQRGLTVDDVAHETKIRSWQLTKIESESFDGLPASVYVRGFVIQYARFLELSDPEQLATLFLQRMATAGGTS